VATGTGALHSWYSKGLYVKAALLSEAYSVASSAKIHVSDHFIEFGVLPNSNSDAGLPVADSLFGTSVRRVSVHQGGVIEVDFAANRQIGAESMIFTPSVSPISGYLFWRCYSDSIDRDVLRKLRPACNHQPATVESDLIIAIKNRNLQSFDNFMERGVDLEGFTHGITPLMVAASVGDPEMLSRLIERGVEMDRQARNHDGLTALMIAIHKRHEDIVSMLLSSGASTSVRDNHGRAAGIHAAQIRARFGDDRFSTLVQQTDNPQFLSHPAESHLPEIYNYYPTVDHGILEAQIKLIREKCLVTTDEAIRSQLSTSCDAAMSKLVKLSREKPEIASMTLNLAIDELTESTLLEHGDDFVIGSEQINAKGVLGQASLIKAIAANKPEFAGLLVSRGADVNVLTSQGSRPLIEASKLGNTQLVKHLMTHGADLHATDSLGRTALLAAVGRGHYGVVDALIQSGAQTRVKDKNGIDALLMAKNRRLPAIERLLVMTKQP